MKKILFLAAICIAFLTTGCNNKCKCNCNCSGCECSKDASAAAALDFEVADKALVDLADFAVDADGYITLFDGQTLKGWRGYGMDEPPTSWDVEDGAIHLKGSGTGEAQVEGGGDLIFAHKFRNFDFEFEYKISEGEGVKTSYIFLLTSYIK